MHTLDGMVYQIGTQKVSSRYWGNPGLTISDLMFHIEQEGRKKNENQEMLSPNYIWEGEAHIIKNMNDLLEIYKRVSLDIDIIFGQEHELTAMAEKIVNDGEDMFKKAEEDILQAKKLALITFTNIHYQGDEK